MTPPPTAPPPTTTTTESPAATSAIVTFCTAEVTPISSSLPGDKGKEKMSSEQEELERLAKERDALLADLIKAEEARKLKEEKDRQFAIQLQKELDATALKSQQRAHFDQWKKDLRAGKMLEDAEMEQLKNEMNDADFTALLLVQKQQQRDQSRLIMENAYKNRALPHIEGCYTRRNNLPKIVRVAAVGTTTFGSEQKTALRLYKVGGDTDTIEADRPHLLGYQEWIQLWQATKRHPEFEDLRMKLSLLFELAAVHGQVPKDVKPFRPTIAYNLISFPRMNVTLPKSRVNKATVKTAEEVLSKSNLQRIFPCDPDGSGLDLTVPSGLIFRHHYYSPGQVKGFMFRNMEEKECFLRVDELPLCPAIVLLIIVKIIEHHVNLRPAEPMRKACLEELTVRSISYDRAEMKKAVECAMKIETWLVARNR